MPLTAAAPAARRTSNNRGRAAAAQRQPSILVHNRYRRNPAADGFENSETNQLRQTKSNNGKMKQLQHKKHSSNSLRPGVLFARPATQASITALEAATWAGDRPCASFRVDRPSSKSDIYPAPPTSPAMSASACSVPPAPLRTRPTWFSTAPSTAT